MRAGQIATSTGEFDSSSLSEEELRRPLTAGELRELIFSKYGKSYDISFVRRDFPGKTFVRQVRAGVTPHRAPASEAWRADCAKLCAVTR